MQLKILLLIFLTSTVLLAAVPNFRGGEYSRTSNETIKLAWDIDPNVTITFWEVKAVWVDVTPNQEYNLGATPNNFMVVNYIRPGHFVYGVRACLSTTNCSDWSLSDNIAYSPSVENSDGTFEPCIWRVNWKLAPPPPPVFD